LVAAVAAEGWTDVSVASFPVSPPMTWGTLRPLLGAGCTQVGLVGCACLEGLGDPPADWPQVHWLEEPRCAHLVAAGGDHLRARLARLVAEWRLLEGRRESRQRERDHARELADHQAAMDFLGRLPLLKDERETLAAVEEMFHMLFAPQVYRYVRFEGGTPRCDEGLSPELERQVVALNSDWAWTESQAGFLLRIARAGETLGVVAVDHFAFPQYANRYVSLALSIAGVAGLAIDNARTYRRMKENEVALRKGERALKMAQAMAHLGHWEMDMGTEEIRWSDETYRILGYEPEKHAPSYDALLQAVHPEDRARVERHLGAAREGGRFDIEFRVVLPQGRVRVLHGMAELAFLGADTATQLIGAIRDITTPERTKLLGVLQDITDHKELQQKLEVEAHTDPLTGCANRRRFLELAARELARARRYPEEVSVLMLDLDHFKEFNDQYGHQAGDRVLQRLVRACQSILRAEDALGRLGGEEFAILLPETGAAKALEVAERLCREVASAEVVLGGGSPLNFTTSIGVATVRPEDLSVDAVLERADRALYEAKDAGRNRVVAAAAQAHAGEATEGGSP
jgi:diguanylate cyclase (GGDEF)-like protein